MDKKYFFFDIDGTLTDRKTNMVTPSARIALKKLQEQGHFVAIATGRAHYKAISFMKEVGLTNMVCNGGNGIVIDDVLVENEPLDRRKAVALCKQASMLGYGVLLAMDDSKDVYGNNDLFIQQVGFRKESTRYIIDRTLRYEEIITFYKIYIAIDEPEEKQLTLKDTLGNLRFISSYLMFQADNKKAGIENMVKRVGGKNKDVVVFGDDYNDLIMFDPQWYSVAMGNACQELKDKADYVTVNNIDDGIYKACITNKWIYEE